MAVASQDIPLTREMVYGWLQEYRQLPEGTDIKYYLAGKINALELPDLMVDTSEHESLRDQTSLLDMVMEDLPSYGF